MNAEECLNRFMLDFQFRFSKSTQEDYQRSVKQMLHYTKKPLDAITKHDLRTWLSHLTEIGYRTTTVYGRLCGLKSFFLYCVEEGFIQQNPAEKIPFPHRDVSIPRYLTKEQLTQLRELVEGRVRDRALIEVLYATGMRIGELASLNKADINWSERTLLIASGKGKKGRITVFTPECASRLQMYLNNRTDHLPGVFLNAKGTSTFSRWGNTVMFQTFSEQLGFRVTSHMLRHTFAAHLAQKGMPLAYIQVLLGHDNIQNTKIYTRLYDVARKELYDEWM